MGGAGGRRGRGKEESALEGARTSNQPRASYTVRTTSDR